MAAVELPYVKKTLATKAYTAEDLLTGVNREVAPVLLETRRALNVLMDRITSDLWAINVKLHGAVGDGTTDDTVAIQKAFDAAPAGGSVYFPDGTFMLSGTVTKTSALRITGTGTLRRFAVGSAGDFIGPMVYVHGTSSSNIGPVTVDGVTFDGADNGAIVYQASLGNDDLFVAYAESFVVRGASFMNPRARSLVCSYVTSAFIDSCKFFDGPPSSGSASETTCVHSSAFFCSNVSVTDCTFESDITHDAGDKTQAGVVAAAPIAFIATNCEYVLCFGNKSDNAGNLEVYEANRNAIISCNQFNRPHLPAVKIANTQRAIVSSNIIVDPQHWWGYGILVGAYTRLDSYGCLRPDQGQAVIIGNVVTGCKAEYGPIFFQGIEYSTSSLDTRIAVQASYGYTTTNVVTKVGSDYFYTDFDGTTYEAIDQSYLLVRNVSVVGNVIDGFSTTGVYAYLADRLAVCVNSMSNCASLDAATGTTKACVKVLECLNADILDNQCSMLSTTVPSVNGVASSVNGAVATTVLPLFRGLARAKVNGNTFALAKQAYGVYVDDLAYVSIQGNDFATHSFLNADSGYIVAKGNNKYGIISRNMYSLADSGTAPSAANEYNNIQAHFMALRYEDERRTVELVRRVVNAAADFTTPTQVASGKFSVGSQVFVAANLNSSYYLCTVAGHYAPAYAGGTAYAKGDKVMVAGAPNRFYAALVATTGNAPTGADTDNAYWQWQSGNALAVFVTITL